MLFGKKKKAKKEELTKAADRAVTRALQDYDDRKIKNDLDYGCVPEKPIMLAEPYGLNMVVRTAFFNSLLLEDGSEFTWELDRSDWGTMGAKYNDIPGETYKYLIKSGDEFITALYVNLKGKGNTDAVPNGFIRKENHDYNPYYIDDEKIKKEVALEEICELFMETERKICNPIKHDIKNLNFEVAINLLMLVDYMAMYRVAQKKIDGDFKEEIVNSLLRMLLLEFGLDVAEEVDDRIALYYRVFRGKCPIRDEWRFGESVGEESMKEPITMLCAVLGDILINPACANHYETATMLNCTYGYVKEFTASVMNYYAIQIQPFINAMASIFKRCYNDA